MGRRFRPTASKIVEKRRRGNERTSSVDIDVTQIDEEYLNKFLGKIFFWSFTISKVKPHHHTTKLRISTHNFVPKNKIFHRIEEVFPDGCEIKLVRGYQFTHSFDLKLSNPMRYDEIIWRVTRAMEEVL